MARNRPCASSHPHPPPAWCRCVSASKSQLFCLGMRIGMMYRIGRMVSTLQIATPQTPDTAALDNYTAQISQQQRQATSRTKTVRACHTSFLSAPPGSAFSSAFGTRKTTRRHNVARSDVIQNQGLLRLRIPASRSDLSARSLAPRWTLSSDRDIWWGIGILEQQMTSGVRHQPQPLALFLAAKAP